MWKRNVVCEREVNNGVGGVMINMSGGGGEDVSYVVVGDVIVNLSAEFILPPAVPIPMARIKIAHKNYAIV